MATTLSSEITIYGPEVQGRGEFDGGKITEIKPIGFPSEKSAAKRIGPLFYWAWASAKKEGVIGLHPHEGFEILSYCLSGELGHSDTLGTKSKVGPGGVQIIQSGSGISHREEILQADTDFFQIWFEPWLKQALLRDPRYQQFSHLELPTEEENGIQRKSILGGNSPISLVADVIMQDISIKPGFDYTYKLNSGRALAAVTVNGEGSWLIAEEKEKSIVRKKDFVIVQAQKDRSLTIKAENAPLRSIIIEIPMSVDYPLYPLAF